MAQKIKSIAWAEPFIMYVYVDWKLIKKVVRTLNEAGFKAEDKRYEDQISDDHELQVTVTCEDASVVHKIISNIIKYKQTSQKELKPLKKRRHS